MPERTIVEHLKAQLENAYKGSRWHSLLRALEGITPEEAAWKPPAYAGFPWMRGSIVEIVFHVGGDSLYQLDHALGKRELTWEALQERFEREGGDLSAALRLAEEGYSALQKALESLTDEELQREYPTPESRGKQKRTLQAFFEMMIEHHLYHAGQIVYVRCLYQGLKQQGSGAR